MVPDEVAHLAHSTVLADGGTLYLRPIVPADSTKLSEGFARLSPESRFLRFFSPVDHLSDSQLRYFTEIDYVDHFAWVAYVLDDQGAEVGVGVARYIRSRVDPRAAEAAVAVADDHHRRGIGSVLLEALAAVALTHGVCAFHLLVRSDNYAMIAAMADLGAVQAPNDDFSVIRYVLDLPQLADDLRTTPMWRVFQLVGAGVVTHDPRGRISRRDRTDDPRSEPGADQGPDVTPGG